MAKKIDFAHRSGALAHPGSRKLRAVKIPASYPPGAKLTHKKHRHTYSWVQRRTNVYGRVWAMFWTIFDRTDMKISLYR